MIAHRWSMQKEGSTLSAAYVYSCAGCGAVVKRRRRLVSRESPPPAMLQKAGIDQDCFREQMARVEQIMES